MNTEDMRQHFEADGSPRRIDSRTDVGVGSGDLFGVWEYFRDRCYYDMYAVRPVGEKRWGHCFHLVNHDEAKGLAELLTKLSLPGRSGTHDVQQETGSVGTGGDSISPNMFLDRSANDKKGE